MSDLTERARVEAERRWPREGRPTTNAGNPLTPKGWLDEGMASGFVVGAAWAAEQGADWSDPENPPAVQAWPQEDFPCCSTGGDCSVGAE